MEKYESLKSLLSNKTEEEIISIGREFLQVTGRPENWVSTTLFKVGLQVLGVGLLIGIPGVKNPVDDTYYAQLISYEDLQKDDIKIWSGLVRTVVIRRF